VKYHFAAGKISRFAYNLPLAASITAALAIFLQAPQPVL